MAVSFDEARVGFEADWNGLPPEIPNGAFEEYRHDHESRAVTAAIRARGEKFALRSL